MTEKLFNGTLSIKNENILSRPAAVARFGSVFASYTAVLIVRFIIADLDTPICGGSQILNTVYVSTEPVITLVFKRKKSWWGDDRTKFNMTFMAYFEGK